MNSKKLHSIIALFLVLCMLFISCAPAIPEEPDTDENKPTEDTECTHAQTTTVFAKDPTCTEKGYTGDVVCTACAQTVTAGTEIPMLQHSYNDGEITKNPTCITTGTTTYTCSGCGCTKTSEIPTVPHDDVYHDALDGTHNHTCTNCTLNENGQHNPRDEGTFYPASCLESAYTEYTCLDCEGVYKVYSTKEEDQAPGHDYGEWDEKVAPTCSAPGSKIHTCHCGAYETVEIPASAVHSFKLEGTITEANCVTEGIEVYKCEECGKEDERTVAPTGVHNYEELESTGDGWVRKMCVIDNCKHLVSHFDASTLKEATLNTESIPDDSAFEITTQNAGIEFPKDVVDQIKSENGEKVSIGADILNESAKDSVINNATKLTEEEKARLESVDIYDFTVSVGETAIKNFNSSVTVTMGYTLNGEEDADGIVIWYVATDGQIERITDVKYDDTNKTVTFSVSHFSYYAVAYEETQALKCKRGVHLYEATDIVFHATCENYGYTVYECSHCHQTTVDDIVQKKNHTYGEIIKANPTCDSGDYDRKECTSCHTVLNLTYHRATGHNLDKVADCEDGSVCTVCNKTVIPAKGHQHTDWTVVVEPTEASSGLRRRYCLRCGGIEEVKIAATGEITPLTFSSYEEMLEALIDNFIGTESGIFTTTYAMNGITVNTKISYTDENGSTFAILEAEMVGPDNETSHQYAVYRNGVILFSENPKNQTISDLQSIVFLPYATFVGFVEEYYDLLNPFAEQYLAMAREMLATYSDILGDELNAALAALDIEYTVDELSSVIDSVETVYAYVSLKLGLSTNAEMKDGIDIPTKNDYLNILDLITDCHENDNGTRTYSVNADSLYEVLEAVLGWFEERSLLMTDEVLYEIFADEIALIYPDVTDFAEFIESVENDIPGTMTVRDLIDLVIEVLVENEICTLDKFYETVDSVIFQMTGEEFDSKNYVDQFNELTIDELIAEIIGSPAPDFSDNIYYIADDSTGTVSYLPIDYVELAEDTIYAYIYVPMLGEMYYETDSIYVLSENDDYVLYYSIYGEGTFFDDYSAPCLADIYESIAAMLSETPFGSFSSPLVYIMGEYITIDETIAMIRNILSTYSVDFNFSFTVDKDGKLISLNTHNAINVTMPDEDGNAKTVTVQDMSMVLTDAPDLQLQIKDEFKPFEEKVNSYYDTNGNLVIEGLPADYDYDFNIDGTYVDADLEEILIVDQQASENLGVTIYVTPKHLWNDSTEVQSYIKIGNTLYTYDTSWSQSVSSVVNYSPLINIIEDAENNLPSTDGEIHGYTDYQGEEYAVYKTYFGYFYVDYNGDYYIFTDYSSYWHYNNATGEETRYFVFDESYEYVDFVSGLMIDSLSYYNSQNDSFNVNGADRQRYSIRLSNGKETFIYDGFIMNGVLYIANVETIGQKPIYVNLKAVSTPVSYDYTYEYEANVYLLDSYGNPQETEVTRVNCYVYVPTYFVKVSDGIYVRYDNLNENGISSALDSVKLPDGNTLYVVGSTSYYDIDVDIYNYNEYLDCEILYGFVKIGDKHTVKAYCNYLDGNVISYFYYEEISSMRISPDDYYDVNQFITKNNGNYTISAALLSLLKSNCTENGDAYFFTITGTNTFGDLESEVHLRVGYYTEPYASLDGFGGHSAEESKEYIFYLLFNEEDMGGKNISAKLDDNGNLCLYFTNGANILYSNFDFCNQYPADKLITRNDKLSNETGLEIYSFDYHDYSSSYYVYQNGKYYRYSTYTVASKVDSSIDAIINNWWIRSMDYRYDTVPFEEEGIPAMHVYETDVSFTEYSNSIFSNSIVTVFTVFYNGELCVLSGAEEIGEMMLKFEDIIPVDEYFSSLTYTVSRSSSVQTTIYIGNTRTNFYSASVALYDEDSADSIGNIRLYYTGTNSFVKEILYVGSRLERGEQVFPSGTYNTENITSYTYYNGTFNIAMLMYEYPCQLNYIKLGDKFYDYDGSYSYPSSYLANRLTESQYLSSMSEKVSYFITKDGDVVTGIYAKYTYNYNTSRFVALEPIYDNVSIPEDANYTSYGLTENGETLYEVTFFASDAITSERLSDGSIFYHRNGKGYLKDKSGYYTKAYRISDGNGGYTIVCDIAGAYLNDKLANDLGAIQSYIYISDNGATITVNREFLEKFKSIMNEFHVSFDADYSSYYLDYYTIEAYFEMLEENQNK